MPCPEAYKAVEHLTNYPESRVRILHIGKFYPPFRGGMESFLAALMDAQTAVGMNVAALVHSHKPDGPPARFDPAAPRPGVVRAPCHGRLLYAPVSPLFPLWLEQTLRDFQPDILHFHLPNTSAFWALASRRARALPWVIHWQSDIVESSVDKRLAVAYRAYRPFEQALLKHAAAIVVTSPPYLESSPALRDWHAKCHVIPLGLPDVARQLPDTPVPAVWTSDLLHVLAIGRLTYYKGFEVLLRAMAQTPFADLVIVGEGEQRAKLQNILAASPAAHRIKLAGNLSDHEMRMLQDSCDVFCLPSLERTEAFGIVLLEAMQRAKAVIASNIEGSGVGWVIEEGKTGWLFPPGDAEALADRLRLAQSDETRAQFGQAGRIRFERHFQIDRIVESLVSIYQLATR